MALPTDVPTNPYLAARYIHNERYCSLTRSIRNWQLVGGALLLANIGLTSGLVYVTSQQQIAPYIVEVDAAGSAVAVRELRAEAVHDPLVVATLLKRFLTDIRTLSTDTELRTRQMNTAYRMCLAPAQNYLTAYYTENKIEDLLQRGRTSALRSQDDTRGKGDFSLKELGMPFAPHHSCKPTSESEKVSVEKAVLIWLIGSFSAWVGVYLLFRSVVGWE